MSGPAPAPLLAPFGAPTPGGDSLGAWVARAAERADRGLRFLDRRERERWLPWPELVARGRQAAGGLQAAGIRPGDRVGLCFPTGDELVVALLGALSAGAAATPLPPPQRLADPADHGRRLAAMTAAAGCRLVFAAGELRGGLAAALAAAPPELGVRTLDDLPAGRWSDPGCDDDALGLVQFSSGTTAHPKPVALRRGALAAQARLLNGLWPERDGVTPSGVCWLPLHHDMGLIGCLLPALERPAELTLLPPEVFAARPALWLRALSRTRAAVSPAPTFGYALCLRRVRDEELAGVDLSAWRFALCGAEPVAPEVLRTFAARFAPWGFRAEALTPVYGLAEAALAVTFGATSRPFASRRYDRVALRDGRALPAAGGRELVSVGRPLAGMDVAVRDGDRRVLPERRVGTVWTRGPSLMDGYLGRPEETARVLRDGWLDTGDLGFVDGGELFLVGRARDLVILRGRNHAAEEIEGALAAVPGLRPERVVAVGWLPEDGVGEELLVFVERLAGRGADGDDPLAEACREAVLAAVGVLPGHVVVLPPGTLPTTSSGKLRRREALARFLAGELGSAAAPPGSGATPR
jgi:fatty-acyl-CoA synthase